MLGICKLCLQKKKLIKKSHIIPNFMYAGIFNDDHVLYKININEFDRSQKLYTGEYESDILCEHCDNDVIGQYETYAHKILYGGRLYSGENIEFQNQKNQHGFTSTYIKGVDYEKFKLFLLSLLWRASISSRDLYKQISLGPHEDIIRKMIINGCPKKQMEYPCMISTYLHNKKELSPDFIGQPIKVKNNDGTRYVFLIGGFLFMFFISQHGIPEWISELVINENNEFRIPHMSKDMGKEMLNYFLGIEMFK